MIWGEWTDDDLPAVVALLNRVSPYDTFVPEHVREMVFQDPQYRPDLLLGAWERGRLVAVAAGVVRQVPGSAAPPVGYLKLLAVVPERQRQGLGSALLARLTERLQAAGATALRVFGDSPAYLRPGVDFRLTPLVCFLLRHGFEWRRHAVNMEARLPTLLLETQADEERLRAQGITIRRLTPADAEAFQASMARDWSWFWQVEAGRTLRRQPISTFIALAGEDIIGFASYDATGPGQFGPMGVAPTRRGLGIGAVLLKRCLADMRERGYVVADIQWVGPIAFYARTVGAVISRCFWQYERPLAP